MDITAIVICTVLVVVLGALIQKSNKEYSLLLSVLAAVLILLVVLQKAAPLFDEINGILNASAAEFEYLSVMLKAAGIALMGQIGVNLCKDAGESALAYAVDFAAKLAILLAALPVLTKIFEYLAQIIGIAP